jgi:molybdopterin synthase sulfur carrier subunit
MIELRYFARFREELGVAAEELEIEGEPTLEELLAELRDRGGPWVRLFAPDQRVMMAVNQEVADLTTSVKDGDEVALFPPVTGG